MSYSTDAEEARAEARALWGDSAYSRACVVADALERAAAAEQSNRAVVSGAGRDCPSTEVVGLDCIDAAMRERFLAALAEPKACGAALDILDGCKATVTRRGRWVIDLSLPADRIATFRDRRGHACAPSAPVTNSHGTWVVVLWSSMPAIPALAAEITAVAESLRLTGVTPGQRREAQSRLDRRLLAAMDVAHKAMHQWYEPSLNSPDAATRRKASSEWGEALRTADAAGKAAQSENPGLSIDDLAEIMIAAPAAKAKSDCEAAEMAALEAEIAAEEAAKAKAAEEAKAAEAARIAAEQEAKTAAMLGLSPAEWQEMPEKKRRLALHNARRTGKI